MRKASLIILSKLRNQSGAALLYILFTVVFISIVGTGLLMSTTYGTKSVVINEKKQQEFYLAEGALEIFLNELATFNNPDVILESENSIPYTINGREMLVEISGNNPYTLTAGYKESSLIKRSVVIEPTEQVNFTMNTPIITGIGNDKTYLPYESVEELNVFQLLYDYVIGNKEELNDMGFTISEYKGETLTEVPANTIMYTNLNTNSEVEIKNDTLTISGLLLAKQINKTGNSDITLNFNGGTIISEGICQSNAITGSCPEGEFKGKDHNGNIDKWEINRNEAPSFTCEMLGEAVKESANVQIKEQINNVCLSSDSDNEIDRSFNILKYKTQ
ncbi:hypothetical protein [Niallia sp. Krafla_26]|uniref:hypothetical protein n=1 Tax=Niallia sp. Krafla_26 TaxID=3064703 RepID=UPI003D16878E